MENAVVKAEVPPDSVNSNRNSKRKFKGGGQTTSRCWRLGLGLPGTVLQNICLLDKWKNQGSPGNCTYSGAAASALPGNLE